MPRERGQTEPGSVAFYRIRLGNGVVYFSNPGACMGLSITFNQIIISAKEFMLSPALVRMYVCLLAGLCKNS